MNAAAIIRRYKTGDYDVTRPSAGTVTNGVFTPGATSTFSISASIQPIAGRDLKSLPESRHAEEIRSVWTTTELRVEDTVDIGGETWEVIRAQMWPSHYRAYLARKVTP